MYGYDGKNLGVVAILMVWYYETIHSISISFKIHTNNSVYEVTHWHLPLKECAFKTLQYWQISIELRAINTIFKWTTQWIELMTSESNSHAFSVYSDVCVNTSVISISNHFILVQQCDTICICGSVFVSLQHVQCLTGVARYFGGSVSKYFGMGWPKNFWE